MRVKLALLIMSLFLLVGCDHATKFWAETSLKQAPHIQLVGGVLDLRYAANHDSAFSLLRHVPLSTRAPFLLTFGIVGIAGLAIAWYRRRRAPLMEQGAYLLMMAGAVGNVADRVGRGYVVDFIHLHHWPIFNVADALLVVGVGLLFLTSVKRKPPEQSPEGVNA